MRKEIKERIIKRISVSGYKSIYEETSIEVKNLTILAGTNSSGKSSFMQPLLILKQTLEATFDPGGLLIYGPCAKFTSFEQLLSRLNTNEKLTNKFSIKIELENESVCVFYKKDENTNIVLDHIEICKGTKKFSLSENMSHKEILKNVNSAQELYNIFKMNNEKREFSLVTERGLYGLAFGFKKEMSIQTDIRELIDFKRIVTGLIHLPGLRGNPERTYPVTATNNNKFAGRFDNYTASIITQWQKNKDARLNELGKQLKLLGLTSGVFSRKINDVEVEILVDRISDNHEDMVNIVDVGFGVSQILPLLVALLVANKNQIVYVEQPELHLHPRAQINLASILASSAKKGVTVIIETHSSILLKGIQILIAKKEIPNNLVKLHWFTKGNNGFTKVSSADVDENGSFGDWPEDFGEISFKSEMDYLDAVELRNLGN